MKVTAKVALQNNLNNTLTFVPDYADGRNEEWASATPALSLTMTVKPEVAELFTVGGYYTLTFEPSA